MVPWLATVVTLVVGEERGGKKREERREKGVNKHQVPTNPPTNCPTAQPPHQPPHQPPTTPVVRPPLVGLPSLAFWPLEQTAYLINRLGPGSSWRTYTHLMPLKNRSNTVPEGERENTDVAKSSPMKKEELIGTG
jgi:hypothetical protein